MDNRITEIRSKISSLRARMVRVEDAMRDQIKQDLDCRESALRLMALRTEMTTLVAEWKAVESSEALPTIQRRLKANNRPAQKPKIATRR